METAHEIRKNDSVVKIIFLTSSPEFALESYDVKASGYLLKPTTYEKLCSLLNDCKQAFHYEPESIIVKTDKGYRKIYYHLIECVEAQNKKVLFCLNDGECLEVLDTFVHCSNELTTNDAFYKCHRSYLVHMPAIDHFNSIEIETKTHKKVPIARSFVSALFLDIRINKKNVICLFLFFYIDLVLQGIFYFTKDLSAVISLYPFITHLPLLLFFVLIFKKRLFPSLIAITSAYFSIIKKTIT